MSGRPTPLVDFLVIGAMKCGTTSLHRYLDRHPELGLAPEKEVNFFFGGDPSRAGNWWRGETWYRRRFPRGASVVGEVSPGYTSPDHPEVAGRIARCAPGVQLVFVVRDPLDRAVSQYRHHRRDGTEPRPLGEAIVDPTSHYVRRSRYADCIRPFLRHFPPSRIAVVDHHDLHHRREASVAWLCRFLGVDPDVPRDAFSARLNRSGSAPPQVPAPVASKYHELVADDAAAFEQVRRALVSMRSPEAERAGVERGREEVTTARSLEITGRWPCSTNPDPTAQVSPPQSAAHRRTRTAGSRRQ